MIMSSDRNPLGSPGKTRARSSRATGLLALLCTCLPALPCSPLPQKDPQDTSTLQRDQREILLKAERMRAMMENLATRYEKEGATDKVRLLRDGLKHLSASKLLEDVAAARQSLDSGALNDALLRQQQVITELEKLLSILLERPTVESLEKEAATAEAMRQMAEDLAKRQDELRKQLAANRDASKTAAEQQLDQRMGALEREMRREADANSREAGLTRPTLEGALERVKQLQTQQSALEQTAEAELKGTRTAAEELSFRMGALRTTLDEVQASQARARDLQQLQSDLQDLQRAVAAGDRDRAQSERDSAQALAKQVASTMQEEDAGQRKALEDAARALAESQVPDGKIDEKNAADLLEAARKLEGESHAQQDRNATRAGDQQKAAAEEARRLAEDLRKADAAERQAAGSSEKSRNEAAAKNLEEAADAMQRSQEDQRAGQSERARGDSAQAARKSEDARQAFRNANPDTAQRAREMAETAQDTAHALDKGLKPEDGSPEAKASSALQRADEALRKTADSTEQALAAENPKADAEAARQAIEQSREALDQARAELEQALARENQGREGAMQSAAARNQQLREQAQAAREELGKQAQEGGLSQEQSDAAQKAMQEAEQAIEQAQQELQQGSQSRAANRQQQAADATRKARDEMARNRPPSEQQKDEMARLAEEQKQLEDEIARLAELLEKRQDKRPSQSARSAEQSAQQAQESLKQNDSQRADQEQQEAEQKLKETAKQLQKERDRYQDLRQEELLFRIGEELNRFLEQQKPITVATGEAGKQVESGTRMTRPMRRSLNQLGDQERELAGKLRFIYEALAQEGSEVFAHVLQLSERDLLDVHERLGAREPDPGEYTRVLQQDVEDRTQRLISALDKERQRRREEAQRREREQSGEGEGQGNTGNQFGPQRERLVPILSEALKLKEMEEDMIRRTENLQRVFGAAGGDGITPADAALAERLAWQHAAITELFQKLRAQLTSALQGGQGDEGGAPHKDKEERK